MAAVACGRFSQNAWRREMCANCFKPKTEHAAPPPRPPAPPPTAVPQHSILKGVGKRPENKAPKPAGVCFPKEEAEIIGYDGGDVSTDDEDNFESTSESDLPDSSFPELSDAEDKALQNLTRKNTDFNSDNLNLLKASAAQPSATNGISNGNKITVNITNSVTTNGKPKSEKLELGKSVVHKSTVPIVPVTPFGSKPTAICAPTPKERFSFGAASFPISRPPENCTTVEKLEKKERWPPLGHEDTSSRLTAPALVKTIKEISPLKEKKEVAPEPTIVKIEVPSKPIEEVGLSLTPSDSDASTLSEDEAKKPPAFLRHKDSVDLISPPRSPLLPSKKDQRPPPIGKVASDLCIALKNNVLNKKPEFERRRKNGTKLSAAPIRRWTVSSDRVVIQPRRPIMDAPEIVPLTLHPFKQLEPRELAGEPDGEDSKVDVADCQPPPASEIVMKAEEAPIEQLEEPKTEEVVSDPPEEAQPQEVEVELTPATKETDPGKAPTPPSSPLPEEDLPPMLPNTPPPVLQEKTPSPVLPVEIPPPVLQEKTPSPVLPVETSSPVLQKKTPLPELPVETPPPVLQEKTPSPVLPMRTPPPVPQVKTPPPVPQGITPLPVLLMRTPPPVPRVRTPSPVRQMRTPPPRPANLPSPGSADARTSFLHCNMLGRPQVPAKPASLVLANVSSSGRRHSTTPMAIPVPTPVTPVRSEESQKTVVVATPQTPPTPEPPAIQGDPESYETPKSLPYTIDGKPPIFSPRPKLGSIKKRQAPKPPGSKKEDKSEENGDELQRRGSITSIDRSVLQASKKNVNRFSLKRIFRKGSKEERATSPDSNASVTSTPSSPESPCRPEIIHPSNLDGRQVEVVSRMEQSPTSPTTPTTPTTPTDVNAATPLARPRPPPPPRTMSLPQNTANRPARPPPPQSMQLLQMRERASDPNAVKPEDSIYANLDSVKCRVAISAAASKAQRSGNAREQPEKSSPTSPDEGEYETVQFGDGRTLKRRRSVILGSLEENYGAVVGANHRALAQLLSVWLSRPLPAEVTSVSIPCYAGECRNVDEKTLVVMQILTELKKMQQEGATAANLDQFRVTRPKDATLAEIGPRVECEKEVAPNGSLPAVASRVCQLLAPTDTALAPLLDASDFDRSLNYLELKAWGPELAPVDREVSLQRWLDLERATALQSLAQNRGAGRMPIAQEMFISFLVEASAVGLALAAKLD
ncbi:proteoglycan 4-like [Cloeon dipterum]|uniref:proteoglycan 4-like n=1 Tax=Cloeon dipterum TaxID=197152 RepID=UPI00322020C6